MATNGGAANGYYNQQYSMESQGDYRQNQAGYAQPPPNYAQDNGQKYGAQGNLDNKQTFDSAFKIQKPKYNDIVFGILVRNKDIPHKSKTYQLCSSS